ncbi:C40 family peptidase [Sanguibacter antarcticus]|uniref:Cell wall-associated NlpC family hydrolase n=1 Tax=Sanguibacter antarcticus TaxID=372484 RepID=A0A2A9E0S3_9MICO|nr:C40 family peptidase [Sanguibacter antarcticus]PFG32236.1 cell wall-associated NlpC family hydrolase [Sanguibacter antarcticus]
MTGIAAVLGRIQEIETVIKAVAPAASRSVSTAAASTSAASVSAASTSFASVLDAFAVQDTSTDLVAQAAAATATVPAASNPAASTPGASGEALVAEARKFLGVPYAWGGESMSGIDCSGLVQRALGALGVDMPRVARDQMKEGVAVASMAEARAGDLLVFGGGSHIAIYVGDGRMIDAPKPGDVVRERDVYETPTAIRRVLPDATSVASTTPATQISEILASSAAQRSSLALLLGAAA